VLLKAKATEQFVQCTNIYTENGIEKREVHYSHSLLLEWTFKSIIVGVEISCR